MIQLKNKKIILVRTVLSLVVLVGLVSGFLWINRNGSLLKTKAAGNGKTKIAATTPVVQWEKDFGGSKSMSVQQTSDGEYITAGVTYATSSFDFWLAKIDTNGTKLWDETFGGTGDDQAYSVQQTSDGGYIISGSTTSFGAGSSDFWLIKTDANGATCSYSTLGGNCSGTGAGGVVTFAKTFGGWSDDQAYSVQQTSDKGYIIAGNTESYGRGSSDIWLIKTDTNGTTCNYSTLGGNCSGTGTGGVITFARTFGSTNIDASYSAQQTSDGGYIIAGSTNSFGAGSSDIWLIKTDANGNLFRNDNNGIPIPCEYYVGGLFGGTCGGVGAGGVETFATYFGGTGDDQAYSVRQASDGGYIIAGSTSSYGAGSSDIWLIKTDTYGATCNYYGDLVSSKGNCSGTGTGGVVIFAKTFGGTGADIGYSVQQTSDGGCIVSGQASGGGAYLVKTDLNGAKLWDKTFGWWSGYTGHSVQQTSDGGYIIAGDNFNYHIWLAKLASEYICGNGICEAGETSTSCPADCPSLPSGGLGTLKISASFSPSAPSSSVVVGYMVKNSTGVVVSSGDLDSSTSYTANFSGINSGLYYVTFDPISTGGYTTPEPDADTSNDDPGNLDPKPTDANQGRRIYVTAGQTNTMNVTYRKESELKQIGRTTAETLLFSPSAPYKTREWSLFRGVAEISADGGVNWQKSIAEVLYIGTTPKATIIKNGSQYLAAGAETEYSIDFSATYVPGLTYDTTIVDEISVSSTDPTDVNKIIVTGARWEPISTTCGAVPVGSLTNISSYTSTSKTITYNLKSLFPNCTYRVWLKIKALDSITDNVTVSDKATITSPDESQPFAIFTTSVIPPYAKENVGGDIYARGNLPNNNVGTVLDLGKAPLGNGLYVLGGNGNVSAVSEQNWILEGYKIRAKSTTDFNPDDCAAGTTCKAMKDNIDRLKNNPTNTIPFSNISSLNIGNSAPEGEVLYKSGVLGSCALTIDSTTDIPIPYKGTLLIENCDVVINQNIKKSSNSILGIIVHNGNVTIGKDVTEVDALFYIYSDLNSSKGSFITLSRSPDYDDQLIIKGLVISSGTSDGVQRKDAFILQRNYVGVLTADPFVQAPAELFEYDGSIIVNPPPGFGGSTIKQ